MYMTWDGKYNTFNNICQWGKDKLRGIVLYEEWYNVNLLNITKNNNLDLYLHTVNNLDKAKKYLKEGVKGIYTDFISQL